MTARPSLRTLPRALALLASLSTVALAASAFAQQPAPFDMSPERGAAPPSSAPAASAPAINTPTTNTPASRLDAGTPPPSANPAPTESPSEPAPSAAPSAAPVARTTPPPPFQAGSAPSPQPAPSVRQTPAPPAPPAATPTPAAPATATAAPPSASRSAPSGASARPGAADAGNWKRHLIAGPELSLSGEIDRRRWSIPLTREEADAPATLRIAYQNAIFVAPEASHLRVLVNDTRLIEEPVASPSTLRELAVRVPEGLLRPGLNTITVESDLRHRTDCTIRSTFDLWTEIDSARSVLEFSGTPAAFGPRRLDDLRATGLDASGQTRLRVLAPDGDAPDAAEPLLRLTQGLSLLTAMPNQRVEIVQGAAPPAEPGVLDVAFGPAAALAPLVPDLPASAGAGTTLAFLPGPEGRPRLVVTGPNWQDVMAGAERIVAFAGGSDLTPRPAIANPALRTPDAPLVREGGTVTFRDLGVPSQEFSGRRFRTEFAVAVPGDFFAEAYGEALLRLDAAYSADIRPGSEINVYVNGNIATTLPIGGGGRGILDAFPLKVTMRHLRPGANTIAIEANLQTEADEVCAPGATAGGPVRFALFDTSRIEIPAYARIARVPDLAAMQGVGFPYNRAEEPVTLVLGDDRIAELDMAATFLSRLTFVAGRAFPIDLGGVQGAPRSGNAIFIGTPRQLPPSVLARANIDPASAALWGGQAPSPDQPATLSLERWRQQFGEDSGWRSVLQPIGEWVRSTFDIEQDGLRFLPGSTEPLAPGPDATLLIGQGESPTPGYVWTVVSAPTTEALRRGVADIAGEANWVQLAGHATTLDGSTGRFVVERVGEASFLPSQPFSLANLRLIVANWLSENVLAYATLIVLVALLLGLSTTVFVRSLGQK
ncbi:cellulose biosynthesis cyclic di-GMP-binding regulatory protein BcsB [Aureimonas ureilytica]|uniref:cellulose biosynthesis cyclic di-GMP-binding regulatory protein BcsB n=1 Tax=Aureimonas ureilytica TaxID=401562 RepID=UPI003CE6A91A